jgi:hypothetical protein
MYAAYLYILRAFDSAAGARLGGNPDPEREIADGRWPSVAVNRHDSPFPARPDSTGTGGRPVKEAALVVKRPGLLDVPGRARTSPD